ncbi:MAG TPA: hypothetical protein VMD74_02460, partial [Candidatus Methylomirabilis sp.]|nr:hypothetical protein [Candidatus Methylomirabilis sp.]
MPIKLNKYFKIILTLSLAVLFLFGGFDIVRQSVFAQTESDAIGVRVLANPHHFSPLAWYLDQGFKGNPTVLTVDGYDAIQDGRTVYVNVANIDDSGTLYTNIYLISYTQDAKPETVQIFNKILSKWKFNTNLTSTGKCFNQSDVNEVCLADADCSGGGFCDSE